MTVTQERIDEILTQHQSWFFKETLLADLDSDFGDIACCDKCYDKYIEMWPGSVGDISKRWVTLDYFYANAKRMRHCLTKEEYDVLISYERCPYCNQYFENGFYPYNLPFDPPEFFEYYISEIANITSKSPFLILEHEFARKIFDTIQELAKKTEDSMVGTNYFRGRTTSSVTKLDLSEFYKPPKHVVKEGRYNHAGEPMLYLASNVETCFAEIRNCMCFVAHINIQLPLRVLDFSDAYRSHRGDDDVLEALAYSSLISAKNDNDGWYKPAYKFSRFIADCAKAAGFHAIKYPSTRQVDDSHNLVIIDSNLDVDNIGKIAHLYLYDGNTTTEIKI